MTGYSQNVTAALLFMLVSTVLLSSMHGLVRLLSADLHPFVIVFFRNLFGLLAVWPLIMKAGVSSLKSDQGKVYLFRSFVGITAMLSWFFALSKVAISNATALSFSTSIFASIIAWLFLGEVMRLRRWIAIFIGLAGVLVVLRPTVDGFNVYSLLVLLSAVSWGASIAMAKHLSKRDSATTIVGWMSISLTLLSLGPALIYWRMPDGFELAILAVIGILATCGHLLLTKSVQMADTAVVMSIDFSRIIWAALIGILFFGDRLDRWTVVGAAIIFTAGWYIIFRESRPYNPLRSR